MTPSLRALLLFGALTSPCLAEESWLRATKLESGFLFEGIAPGMKFSVDIPGTKIDTANDAGRAFATIDGVLFQFMRSEARAVDPDESLSRYKDWESDYLVGAGATVTDSEPCKGRSFHAAHGRLWRRLGRSRSILLQRCLRAC